MPDVSAVFSACMNGSDRRCALEVRFEFETQKASSVNKHIESGTDHRDRQNGCLNGNG